MSLGIGWGRFYNEKVDAKLIRYLMSQDNQDSVKHASLQMCVYHHAAAGKHYYFIILKIRRQEGGGGDVRTEWSAGV